MRNEKEYARKVIRLAKYIRSAVALKRLSLQHGLRYLDYLAIRMDNEGRPDLRERVSEIFVLCRAA